MPTDSQVNDLKINVLTEQQYSQIQSPSTTELYLVPEVVDTTPTSGSTNPITSGGVYNALQNIPAQEQADWNETDNTEPSYIQNKPDLNATLYEEVTYSQLVTKITNSQLVKGKKYRITDYVTTTTQTNTSSAGHVFDLVVSAIDVNKLDCNASALLHEGDTYFSAAGSDLSKWQIWYDVENNVDKYEWADATNGKGVIYRMIDEWNNDCGYDFKSILFKRKLTNGEYDPDGGVDTWVYTFTWVNENENIEDLSVIGHKLQADDGTYAGLLNNSVGIATQFNGEVDIQLSLFDNVFFAEYEYDQGFFYGCHNNKIEFGCRRNTLHNETNYNTLLNASSDNFLDNNCSYNTINKGVTNKLSGDCRYNIILNSSSINTGTYCSNNEFVISSGIFLGENCNKNYFGPGCSNIYFGYQNTGGNYISNNIFEGNNSFIRFYSTQQGTLLLQNVIFALGLSGLSNNYLPISSITRGRNYRTTVARTTTGSLRIYNEDDFIDPNASLYEEVTYNELVYDLLDNDELIPGRKYRITDYVTTVHPSLNGVDSAANVFDLIVTAIDVNKLDYKASAILHSGDTYFSNAVADLSKWQIWYDVNNLTNKYAWADPNGKGVIYRMIDEWGNDCPYDFKNIQFQVPVDENGEYDSDEGVDTLVYTFNYKEGSSMIDVSTYQRTVQGDKEIVSNNIIKPLYSNSSSVQTHPLAIPQQLNFIVFLCKPANSTFHGIKANIFNVNCKNIYLHNSCCSNKFGTECSNITLYSKSHSNIFGDYCRSINLGPSNIFNIFEGDNSNIYFRDFEQYNTLKQRVHDIIFGNNQGSYGSNFIHVIIENNGFLRLINESNFQGHVLIASGFNLSSTYKDIVFDFSYTGRITIGKDNLGNDRVYNEDDRTRTINGESLESSELGDINIHDGFYFPNAVSDFDGNWYGAVVIGDQVWLGENLRTTHYADGTAITNGEQLSSDSIPYYYFNTDYTSTTLKRKGLLYNKAAAMYDESPSTTNPSGIQAIAPYDWHIPSKEEFNQLRSYLNNQNRYTYQAKSIASTLDWWTSSIAGSVGNNRSSNNATGFNAFPAGYFHNGNFEHTVDELYLHTSENSLFKMSNISTIINFVTLTSTTVPDGYSVRCVSDKSPIQFRDWYINTYGSLNHEVTHISKVSGVSGQTINPYGVCSSSGSSSNKEVTLLEGSLTLETGAKVTVNFVYTNTNSAPTLNVNGTGQKTIFNHKGQSFSNQDKSVLRGIKTFVYDATLNSNNGGWVLIEDDVVYNSQISLQSNDVTIGSFTLNASSDNTISIPDSTAWILKHNPNIVFSTVQGSQELFLKSVLLIGFNAGWEAVPIIDLAIGFCSGFAFNVFKGFAIFNGHAEFDARGNMLYRQCLANSEFFLKLNLEPRKPLYLITPLFTGTDITTDSCNIALSPSTSTSKLSIFLGWTGEKPGQFELWPEHHIYYYDGSNFREYDGLKDSLANLIDVDVAPADRDVLMYDAGHSIWTNYPISDSDEKITPEVNATSTEFPIILANAAIPSNGKPKYSAALKASGTGDVVFEKNNTKCKLHYDDTYLCMKFIFE